MARYHGYIPGSTVASGALIGYLQASTNAGGRLRRVTPSFSSAGSTPVSTQIEIRVYRFTAAGTAGSAITADLMDTVGLVTPNCSLFSGGTGSFTLAPTGGAFGISLNNQSAADLPWEQLEEWWLPRGTANGFAFVNETTLPSSPQSSINLAVEWEE